MGIQTVIFNNLILDRAEVDRDINFTYNLSTGDLGLGLGNTIPIAYKHSQVPWFMNASASYKYIPSESFAEFSTLNSDTGSLPQNLQPLVRLFSDLEILSLVIIILILILQFNIFMLNQKIKYMFQVPNFKIILKTQILPQNLLMLI